MKKKILSIFLCLAFSVLTVFAVPNRTYASDFLLFPPWYRGLDDGAGNIKPIGKGGVDISTFVLIIIGNITSGLLRIVGVLAVIFIIIAGFQYMLSAGNPGKASAAKTTLTNAVVGLIIAILGSVIVDFIMGVF